MDKQETNMVNVNLTKMREHMGYSLGELASLLNVDEALLECWEAGTKEPTISQALLLSRLYAVSVEEIFGCKAENLLSKEKLEEFNYNAWVKRILNSRY